ncbi:galactose-1-phosphate uridylyltransferase, partial [Ruminococcaceae bacterium OttesenSCG-928-L11]|nr:galactose-1-phosphate uridylyltransferase [Ruminococcaceae bacterium OttesenSCG-928-L11]
MAELRYNPLTNDWVMVASHRQARPQMPKNWCPFCPGSGKVPDEGFDVLRYPNDFPALSPTPPTPDDVATDLFQVKPAYGKCEVLLYSDQHTVTVGELSDDHVHKLSRLWLECYRDLSADPNIQYVYIFENRGDVVGVTMPHPHGQVYGYSFIPKKVADELDNSSRYHKEKGRCLFCDILKEEKSFQQRILFENKHFTVFVPFFSPITYGIHVQANRHVPDLAAMTEEELDALGETIRDCAGMYDALFGTTFPYMMCMYNAPNLKGYEESWHFHVKFFPPMRSATVQQFFASSETGAGAWCNPNRPEEKAEELRAAY